MNCSANECQTRLHDSTLARNRVAEINWLQQSLITPTVHLARDLVVNIAVSSVHSVEFLRPYSQQDRTKLLQDGAGLDTARVLICLITVLFLALSLST